MTPTTTTTPAHKVVSRDEWQRIRSEFLAKEKELTHLSDKLAKERQELPWTKVEKEYVFSGPKGKVTLADLFAGRSQLATYHFMFGPDWEEGCPSCSYVMDHLNGAIEHLAARDVSLVAVSRAPLEKLEAFKRRLGWRFPWVSSGGCDFNHDYRVTFTAEEVQSREKLYNFNTTSPYGEECPGLSCFFKGPDGTIYHTFSCYGRGLDGLLTTYAVLDRAPKGRDEGSLRSPMAWVRYHDKYEPTVHTLK